MTLNTTADYTPATKAAINDNNNTATNNNTSGNGNNKKKGRNRYSKRKGSGKPNAATSKFEGALKEPKSNRVVIKCGKPAIQVCIILNASVAFANCKDQPIVANSIKFKESITVKLSVTIK